MEQTVFILNVTFQIKNNTEINKINKHYYSILGFILNILENKNEIYNNILSISPIIKKYNTEDNYFIKISILGENNFKFITQIFLDNLNNIFTLDWIEFILKQLDNNFKWLKLDELLYKEFNFNTFVINFKSPTFLKKTMKEKQINFYLPIPEEFIISAIRKYYKIYWVKINDNTLILLKDKIKYNLFISQFNIETKKIKVKWWIKAGVVWNVKYNLNIKNDFSLEEKNIIYRSLILANFIGLWNWTKLWLWQVQIKFN